MESPTPSAEAAPPRAFRYFEVGSVLLCGGLDVWLAVQVAEGLVKHGPSVPWVATAAAGGYLAADLVSGIVHFIGDSFGSVTTPYLGRTFVLPFRSHHAHPAGICQHDFVETNGNNAFAALLVLVPTLALVPVGQSAAAACFGAFVLTFTVAVLFTNQIHKWAHVPRPPRLVKALQAVGLFLSPARHAPHHRPPHGRGYCVTSGLFNALLDPIDFFPRVERMVRAVAPRSRAPR